jgi:hypothetical protein
VNGFGAQLKDAQTNELIHCMVRGFGQAPQSR